MSIHVRIRSSDVGKALAKHGLGVKTAARRGAIAAALRAQAVLARRTPVDTGMAKAAWRTERHQEGRTVAEVRNEAPYIGIIERGARPHPVSEAGQLAIAEWVKRHFSFLRTGRNSFTVAPKNQSLPGKMGKPRSKIAQSALGQMLMDQSLLKIAQAIVHKLETRGQKPTYFIRDSIPELRTFLHAEINREIEKFNQRLTSGRTGV